MALAAVGGSQWESCVALAADALITVVLSCEDLESWVDDPSPQSEDEVKSRLLLDVVVVESPSVLELLTSEDEPLLVRWNTFLVLNLGLHSLDSVTGIDFKSDRLSSKGLDKDLHLYKARPFFYLLIWGERSRPTVAIKSGQSNNYYRGPIKGAPSSLLFPARWPSQFPK